MVKFSSLIFIFIFIISGCSQKQISLIDYSYDPTKAAKPKDDETKLPPTMRPYKVLGSWYYPNYVEVGDKFDGVASWYGPDFHGKLTSNGEVYDMDGMSAAHKTMPMNTILKVTNLNNSKSVKLRINDRGPFVDDRIIDLSKTAAKKLGIIEHGTTRVRLEVIGTEDSLSENSEYKKHYFVQIASFTNKISAKKLQKKYQKEYFNQVIVIKEKSLEGKKVYKVCFSGFKNSKEAREFKSVQFPKGYIYID